MTDDNIIRNSQNNYKQANEIINNTNIDQLSSRPPQIKAINTNNLRKSEFTQFETKNFLNIDDARGLISPRHFFNQQNLFGGNKKSLNNSQHNSSNKTIQNSNNTSTIVNEAIDSKLAKANHNELEKQNFFGGNKRSLNSSQNNSNNKTIQNSNNTSTLVNEVIDSKHAKTTHNELETGIIASPNNIIEPEKVEVVPLISKDIEITPFTIDNDIKYKDNNNNADNTSVNMSSNSLNNNNNNDDGFELDKRDTMTIWKEKLLKKKKKNELNNTNDSSISNKEVK